MHAIIYSKKAEATREFFRDVLGFPWGRLAHVARPGGQELGIYEPRHPTAIGPRA